VQIHKRSTRVRAIASRGARLTQHESIDLYIQDVCSKYKVDPELVKSIIYHESRYNPKATNGNCVGLMQLSKRWHADRAKKLGVTNFYDPYENILVGVDYLSELFDKYKDPELVLMLYNMKHNTALRLYKQGKTSRYAKSILAMTKTLEKGE
jgi:soluble lytic murein transglycosylase-like protein